MLTRIEEYHKAFIKFENNITPFICIYMWGIQCLWDNWSWYCLSILVRSQMLKKLMTVRNCGSSNLKACKTEQFQQFFRENYISWNNAQQKITTIYHSENNGWLQAKNQYHFKWFEGDHLPNDVRDSLKNLSGI